MFRKSLVALLLLLAALQPAARGAMESSQEIVEATRLFEQGRFQEAAPLIARLRSVPEPSLQVLFLSGALYLVQGRYREAAEEFRLMLARDPSLVRPRLELARALFLAGDYQTARYHFEQVLASPLPPRVQSNILNFILMIREQLPSFAFTFDVVSDSNPKQATSSEVVIIGGLPFVLSDSSRADSARGVMLTGYGKVPLPKDRTWYGRGYLERTEYPGSELDFTYGHLGAGKLLPMGRHRVELEAGAHVAHYAKETLYHGGSARISDFIRVLPTWAVTIAADAKQLRYRDLPFLSGWQRVGSAELRHAIDPQSSLAIGASYVNSIAQEDAYSYNGAAGSVRYVREWKGGWIGSLSYQYGQQEYDEADPFFGVERDDRESRAELGITNRLLSYRSVAPRLTIGTTERKSNIDLYSYRRTFVRVGLVTEF
jgi:tetratricopeptide (TPR) repeat protein